MEIYGLNFFNKSKKKDNKDVNLGKLSPVPPHEEEGLDRIVNAGAGHYGYYYDIDGSNVNEKDLILKYREISQYSECDAAIEDIVNESIVSDNDSSPVRLILDDLNQPEKIKKMMYSEFDKILELLNFNWKSHELFRKWYVDGRLYYHKIIDPEDTKKGILELRLIDPTTIRKIREIEEEVDQKTGIKFVKKSIEYFIYSPQNILSNNKGIKIPKDSICYVTSGVVDSSQKKVLSYLHKAIKPVNQLRMLEDSLVIYRLSRAPERRVFYIDVGNLPKGVAEEYMRSIISKYRNKIVYDAKTGEVIDNKQHMCLAMDTKVPLLDGRTLTITQISNELNSGKTLWVYSCDPATGMFEPGLVTFAGVTRKNAEVLKITLDNGKFIICTHDHKFPVWNKGFVRADELTEGESMIPHYTRKEQNKVYEEIFDNVTKKWVYTHHLVSQWKMIHYLKGEYYFGKNHDLHYDNNVSNNNPENIIHTRSNNYEINQYLNHKVVKIERLDDKIDTGCLIIDENEIFHGHHTFALDAGIYTKNSMLEDFWLPRREGGKGTEVTTLSGGDNLSSIDDIIYFQRKMYKSLNVPISRLESDTQFSIGRATEITRDELKFQKFINKIRKQFSTLFIDLLKTQIILKEIITEDEWEAISQKINIDYLHDNHFAELKDMEILSDRLRVVQEIEPYIGNYYSRNWVKKNILLLSDEDINKMKEEIDQEKKEEPPEDSELDSI